MYFTNDDPAPECCQFCGSSQADITPHVALFGFQGKGPPASICHHCLLAALTAAIEARVTITPICEPTDCAFCGERLGDFSSYYVRGNGGICAECMTYMFGVMLEVNMVPGIKAF